MPSLTVRVHRAKGLTRTGDTLVLVEVRPAAASSGPIRRTKVVKASNEPEFGDTFLFELAEAQLKGNITLVVTVLALDPTTHKEESLGSACFELASNIMMISRKSKVLLTSEGANAGGDVTIEARKSFLPTAAAAQAPVAPSLPSNLAPEEVEGVVGSFKENETGDLSRFLPPTATEVANHKVTTSASALKALGGGVHLGKYAIKIHVVTHPFGFKGVPSNVAFHVSTETVKVDNIIYFWNLSFKRMDVNGGLPDVVLSHVNILGAPRVPKASNEVEASDISLQLCWVDHEGKKSLFVDLMADNTFTTTDRPHEGWRTKQTVVPGGALQR